MNQVGNDIVQNMERVQHESVQSDHPCAKCGYSLRTLRVDGVCPECGYAVARSLLSVEDREILLADDRIIAAEPAYNHWRPRLLALAAVMAVTFVFLPSSAKYVVPSSALEDHEIWIALAIAASMALLLSVILALGWFGCRVRCQHAAYVLIARESGDAARAGPERRRDDRICRREDIYRRNIGAAKALFVLFGLGLICTSGVITARYVPPPPPPGAGPSTVPFVLSMVQWLLVLAALIWINTGRLAHAKSIRFHRRLGRDRARAAGRNLSQSVSA